MMEGKERETVNSLCSFVPHMINKKQIVGLLKVWLLL